MNSLKKLLTLFFVFSLLLLTVVGCSDDDEDTTPTGSTNSELFGDWLQKSATYNGEPAFIGEILDWAAGTYEGHVTLYSDYTYQATEVDSLGWILYMETGVIDIDDNWLIVTVQTEDDSTVTPYQSFNGTWAIINDTLNLTQVEAGNTIVLKLIKSN